MNSTLLGMQMSFMHNPQKQFSSIRFDSIRVNREFDSMIIVSTPQAEKHALPRNSTDRGTQIDFSEYLKKQ
jgi:hypothetical protein